MFSPRDFSEPAVRRGWIQQLLAPLDGAKWDDLASELFAWQFARVPAYRRLCLAYEMTPKRFTSWRDLPAVPQQLFKREKLFGHGSAQPAAVYETSGTTTGQPGRQHLLNTDIYKAVSVEGAKRIGLFAHDPQLHFLTPSPREAPESSLSAMFGFWLSGTDQKKEPRFWMRNDRFDFISLRNTLEEQIKSNRAIAISGTAFSFVQLIDDWADLPPLHLPPGSWVLETGGFKGRSREIPKAELYRQLARIFSLRDVDIHNEYGMSELSSQAYAWGKTGLHHTPSWARVLIVDPATGREVQTGQHGLVRWFDLANVDSVFAVQTLDMAQRTELGFELIGRLPRTEPRGCSLGVEDLKAAAVGSTADRHPVDNDYLKKD